MNFQGTSLYPQFVLNNNIYWLAALSVSAVVFKTDDFVFATKLERLFIYAASASSVADCSKELELEADAS